MWTALTIVLGLASGFLNQDEPFTAPQGLLVAAPTVAMSDARQRCLDLPGEVDDSIQGPHGDTQLAARCEVTMFAPLALPRWIAARYVWTRVFTAEDKTRGADARETVTQEEAVLFERVAPGSVKPVWHERFDVGPYGVWRSMTLEIARAPRGTLLSIMRCVNGTGGCDQDFLYRRQDGRWRPLRQTWLDQLPAGFLGRIRHGVRIDPMALRADAGFYGDDDPNCCPSQVLAADLQIVGDTLVLRHSAIVHKQPQ